MHRVELSVILNPLTIMDVYVQGSIVNKALHQNFKFIEIVHFIIFNGLGYNIKGLSLIIVNNFGQNVKYFFKK